MSRKNFRRDRSGRSAGSGLSIKQAVLSSARTYLPLQTGLLAAKGSNLTLSRADATACATVIDFNGVVKTCLPNEIRETGARRVQNLWGIQSATLAVAANNSMTLAAGTYTFSMGAGTGTATFSGTGGATGTLTADATYRTAVTKTITAGTLVVTGSVATLVDLQVETGALASEYVSNGVLAAPYHGAGVDGVCYFPYTNPMVVI